MEISHETELVLTFNVDMFITLNCKWWPLSLKVKMHYSSPVDTTKLRTAFFSISKAHPKVFHFTKQEYKPETISTKQAYHTVSRLFGWTNKACTFWPSTCVNIVRGLAIEDLTLILKYAIIPIFNLVGYSPPPFPSYFDLGTEVVVCVSSVPSTPQTFSFIKVQRDKPTPVQNNFALQGAPISSMLQASLLTQLQNNDDAQYSF